MKVREYLKRTRHKDDIMYLHFCPAMSKLTKETTCEVCHAHQSKSCTRTISYPISLPPSFIQKFRT